MCLVCLPQNYPSRWKAPPFPSAMFHSLDEWPVTANHQGRLAMFGLLFGHYLPTALYPPWKTGIAYYRRWATTPVGWKNRGCFPSLTRALLRKASLKPFNFGRVFAKKKDSWINHHQFVFEVFWSEKKTPINMLKYDFNIIADGRIWEKKSKIRLRLYSTKKEKTNIKHQRH